MRFKFLLSIFLVFCIPIGIWSFHETDVAFLALGYKTGFEPDRVMTSKDYLKAGGIMTFLFIGIAVILMYLFTG